MTPRTLLLAALAALLLPAMAPPASATGGLDLAATSSPLKEGELQHRVEYSLESDVARSLRLTTRVEAADGQSHDHTAAWSIGGTSTRTGEGAASVPAGATALSITFTLAPSVPTGEYRLLAFVRAAQEPGGNGAALAPAAGASADLVLVRDGGGSTGGGGDGGGGGGDGGSSTVGAVTGLTATGVTDRGFTLQWQPVTGDGIAYRVHRSLEGGFEPGAANLVASPSEPRAALSGLQPDSLYHVRVRAVDSGGMPGPLSPELTVRTLQARDATPPGAVAGLRLTKATDHSLALAWDAAQDDRGPLSYEVHRGSAGFTVNAASRVATTTALAYTDATVASATAYAYRVRAVEGAGNAGPPSAELAASTLSGPTDDTSPPAIQRLAFIGISGSWRMTWATDEPATGELLLGGPAGQRSLSHAQAASSSLSLGALPAGLHAFTLTATDAFGRVTVRAGEFRVDVAASGRYEAFAEPQAAEVAFAVAPAVASALHLYWVDGDADGRVDAVTEARDSVTLRHALPRQGAFLLAGPQGLALAWADGRVDAVAAAGAEAVGTTESEAVRAVTVRGDGAGADEAAGWVATALPDPHPGLPLLAVQRQDGTELASEAWWRDGGKAWFLDGPGLAGAEAPRSATYHLLYDNAAGTAGEAEGDGGDGGDGLPAWLPWVAAGLGGILLGVLLTAAALRRRG